MSEDNSCGSGGGSTDYTGLRIASIFIIWVGSSAGALFPVLAKRTHWLSVPPALFDFAKYFGSGVIIATAFINLLSPALEELGSPCLSEAWSEYPYALAIALVSIFFIFIVELLAFRIGTSRLQRLGIRHDVHGHGLGGHAAHGPEAAGQSREATSGPAGVQEASKISDEENKIMAGEEGHQKRPHSHAKGHGAHDDEDNEHAHDVAAQVIGVGILEFGVILHSVLIGLTLAVDPNFKVLFVVLVFHQTFEGLALGSRLAFMRLSARHNYIPLAAAALYGLTTPIGIAAGLGVRTSYNPGSAEASIVSGVLDATSAGILIYTGLVELLAHDFLFSRDMREASNGKVAYAVGCMCAGCALMAVLGRWA